ncbi:MAG: DEAD/DEAH box helicase, partial [Bdellovibrionales bacterium]|nr:DEAD/DEAH box helicase [Bdellovibrionales bacterium]
MVVTSQAVGGDDDFIELSGATGRPNQDTLIEAQLLKGLKDHFDLDTFYSGQFEAISPLMSGKDVLLVLPTGSGKSLCYQLPAAMKDGVALVISPLLSLISDQVSALAKTGIGVARIDSMLSRSELESQIDLVKSGGAKLLYVSPERLTYPAFYDIIKGIEISLIAVDEAHC